jgi:hypothetical protein
MNLRMGIIKIHVHAIIFLLALVSCGNANPEGAASEHGNSKMENAPTDSSKPVTLSKVQKREQSMTDTATSDKSPVFPTCATLQSKNPDDVADLFEKLYPAGLIDSNAVEHQNLTPDGLLATVTFAACAAAKTNFEPFVADGSTALFSSKRHGAAAFAALENMSNKPGFEGKAAKEFAEQMRNYAKGPTE